MEEDNLNVTHKEKNYPILKFSNITNANGERLIKSIQCKSFYISTKPADSCCSLLDGTTIPLTKIYLKN